MLKRSGTEVQKKHAAAVAPVRLLPPALCVCAPVVPPMLTLCTPLQRWFCPPPVAPLARAPQLVHKGHQLLVTLLLMNAAAMEVRVRPAQWDAACVPASCVRPLLAGQRAPLFLGPSTDAPHTRTTCRDTIPLGL